MLTNSVGLREHGGLGEAERRGGAVDGMTYCLSSESTRLSSHLSISLLQDIYDDFMQTGQIGSFHL